ncbi:unnamed protein product, partial [Laminaria digitata]
VIGPTSAFSQALHMVLTFVILVLVAFAKADDGAACTATYGNSAGFGGSSNTSGGGGGGGTGAGSTRSSAPNCASSPSSSTTSSSSSGRQASSRSSAGAGGDGLHRSGKPRKLKRRRKLSGRGSGGAGRGMSSSPIVRRLRAAWSKLWHVVEDDLATRWKAASRALASLREAWAALWVPPPHAEADVLAEALASPSCYSRGDDDRRRRWLAGSAGAGSGSKHTRRRSERGALLGEEDSPSEKAPGRPVGLNCLNLLRLCGHRTLVGAGGGGRRGSSRSPKFLLLLDLDETLVHCSPRPIETARRRSSRGGGGSTGPARALRPDLMVEMRGGAPSDRPACMNAWKRPHLDVFLGVVSRWYEVAVFTSGRQCYAEPLIDLIDSQCVIRKRFYRDSCVQREGSSTSSTSNSRRGGREGGGAGGVGAGVPSQTMKNLEVVGSEHFPLRTVLVDNCPSAVVQQANVLPVESWYPRDSQDRQLLDLLPVLLALTSCQDVRSVLGLRPGV